MSRQPYDRIISLNVQIAAKQTWLSTFSTGRNKRPDHEIDQKRQERDDLIWARDFIAGHLRNEGKLPDDYK